MNQPLSALLAPSLIALFSVGLQGCCAFVGPCTNFQPSPTVQWEDASGRVIPLDSGALEVTSVNNLAEDLGSGLVDWAIAASFTGDNGPMDTLSFVVITDAGEFGNLREDGDRRANRLVFRYRYLSAEYADTLFYDSLLDESQCCTTGRIERATAVRGPLVSGFRNRRDFPGIVITLRDTL